MNIQIDTTNKHITAVDPVTLGELYDYLGRDWKEYAIQPGSVQDGCDSGLE